MSFTFRFDTRSSQRCTSGKSSTRQGRCPTVHASHQSRYPKDDPQWREASSLTEMRTLPACVLTSSIGAPGRISSSSVSSAPSDTKTISAFRSTIMDYCPNIGVSEYSRSPFQRTSRLDPRRSLRVAPAPARPSSGIANASSLSTSTAARGGGVRVLSDAGDLCGSECSCRK